MSHKVDIDDLKKEQEDDEATERSFTANPYKVVIQNFFHNEFSGKKYHNYTFEEAKKMVIDSLTEIQSPGLYLQGGQNIIRKCKKAANIVSLLMIMNEYLFQ